MIELAITYIKHDPAGFLAWVVLFFFMVWPEKE